MASTNSPSVQWVPGEATGKNVAGASTAIPGDLTLTAIPTAAAAPTATPTNGSPFVLTIPASGFYIWDGATWRGAI